MEAIVGKKKIVVDAKVLTEFRDLSAKVYQRSGIRLNVEKAAMKEDRECLRVWERTFLDKGEKGWKS